MPHDLSHSQLQSEGFQLTPLSQTILSTKSSLHSHLHLSLFHIYLVLQTAALNLHTHLQVLCHIICLVSLIVGIRLNTLTFIFLITSGMHSLAYASLILLQFPLHLFTLIL